MELYKADDNSKFRCSDENPDIIKVYQEFLDKPLSNKAHELLHTTYVNRSSDLGVEEVSK